MSSDSTAGPKIRCNSCKEIIQSQHRHDFVTCSCGGISIDGGAAYTRIAGSLNYEFLGLDDKPTAEQTARK